MTDLLSIAADLSAAREDGPLPVENWHPERSAKMDLVIAADGSWIHEGSAIARPALVRLFSRVLRLDGDGYVLVTPVEKLFIEVADVPFLAVDYDRTAEGLLFRTNVGDLVLAGEGHEITLREGPGGEEALPYLHVRGGLLARIGRAAYYRLLDDAREDEQGMFIESGGKRFDLGKAE